mmetsp:Transcript_94918/g.173839  ORF Transcript_94918/g.173839 Transcript_94918/m.173839 type:complete len:125 (+) Transcript_94918:2-376(+)
MDKVRTVRLQYPLKDIEVDGGVKPATVDEASKAGANMIVSGTGIFKAEDMRFAISTMKRSVEKYGNGLPEEKCTPLSYDKDATKLPSDAAATKLPSDAAVLATAAAAAAGLLLVGLAYRSLSTK